MDRRPNVVYLHTHDTGRRIAPYGYALPTPNLSKLARESLLFRQAFCAAPTCSPSRAALLTGQCAHSSGMLGLHHRGFHLNDPSQHLAAVLGRAGYHTALVGVNHVHHAPSELGYERTLSVPSAHAAHVAPAAEAFLRAAPAEPFLLDIGFVETHRGQFPERHELDDPRYLMPPAAMADTPDVRTDYARFASATRAFDDGAGRVLAALAETGLDQRTLLIVTTDHGISFPRHKCTLFDGGIEVLLMMRGPAVGRLPGGIAAGDVCDTLVSQIDLLPTLCEYLEIPPPAWLQGRSLLPVLREDVCQVRQELFAEISYHAAYQPERCVRTIRHKYIRRFGDRLRQPLSNIDDGISKSLYVEHGWGATEQPAEALYDLLFDPLEMNNLAASPGHSATVNDLRGRLDQWMRETRDPLLHGVVPAPPGAVVNEPEDLSAKDALARLPQREATRAT
jgi:N-sulfoglucosamine sulfohydrolase